MEIEMEINKLELPFTGVKSRTTQINTIPITKLNNYIINNENNQNNKFSTRISSSSSFPSSSHTSSVSNTSNMSLNLFTSYSLYNNNSIIKPTKENSIKKCVYMYEDYYTFSRILPAGSLVFNSHFESGNLHSAHLIILKSNYNGKLNSTFYDLYMHEDINSFTGTAQWFYFSVTGMREKQTVSDSFIFILLILFSRLLFQFGIFQKLNHFLMLE